MQVFFCPNSAQSLLLKFKSSQAGFHTVKMCRAEPAPTQQIASIFKAFNCGSKRILWVALYSLNPLPKEKIFFPFFLYPVTFVIKTNFLLLH